MIPTPTDEILAIRRELAARCGNDIHRIFAELRRHELESGRTYITLPPRRPEHLDEPIPRTQRPGAA